jgi:hypothetical protein
LSFSLFRCLKKNIFLPSSFSTHHHNTMPFTKWKRRRRVAYYVLLFRATTNTRTTVCVCVVPVVS